MKKDELYMDLDSIAEALDRLEEEVRDMSEVNRLYRLATNFNGYKNYATWNVALWIGNAYPTYKASQGYKTYPQPYLSFRKDLRDGMLKCETTGDGVSLWDRSLDIERLDEMIREE